MTSLCGAPHHDYPQTLCTEPPGHYVPDRDPHAGPLIIDGRECGGAAWDEPKEQPMTDEAWRTDPRERLLAAIDQTWAYGELAATPEQLVNDYAHQLAVQQRLHFGVGGAPIPAHCDPDCDFCRGVIEAADLIDPKEQR
jgi:hypothetical protein